MPSDTTTRGLSNTSGAKSVTFKSEFCVTVEEAVCRGQEEDVCMCVFMCACVCVFFKRAHMCVLLSPSVP